MSKTFNCLGKVNINDFSLNKNSLFAQKEVENVLCRKNLEFPFVFKTFNCQLPGVNVLLNLKHHTQYLSSQLRLFERHEKPSYGKQSCTINFFAIREEICGFLLYVRNTLLSLNDENFTLKDIADEVEKDFDDLVHSIQRFLKQLREVPDNIVLCSASNIGNKCKQREYHICHIHLDLRWSIISLMFIRDSLCRVLEINTENLEKCVQEAVKDLIFIALKIFATISIKEIKEKIKTPYSCSCVREIWIMLQLFSDELFAKYSFKKNFWTYVYSILNQLLSNDKSLDLPECKNPELFCLWLIYHITLLYGYNKEGDYKLPSERFTEIQSSTSQIEKILKNFVNNGGKEGSRESIDDELCIIIQLIHKLNNGWYKLNIQIISYLYDCFHKRLDQPFLFHIRGHWTTSVEKKSPIDILKEVRERIENDFTTSNDTSSFGLFLNLLGTFLRNNDDQKIWNQIKSRIYSRFSENKIKEFSEAGIYNFISLNLTLAVTADVVNACTAMMNLLPSDLDWDKTNNEKKAALIWKGRLIVLLLYNEHKLSFENINADSFTETANKLSCQKKEICRFMMSWYIDVIQIILMQSKDFSKNEPKFMDGWIDRYLLESADNEVLTNTLLQVFRKLNQLSNSENGKVLMINALWNHLAGRVRLMVNNCDLNTKNYENPTKLAVEFTIEACRDPVLAKKYGHSATSLFTHFSFSFIVKDIRISRLYLSLILKNEGAVNFLKSNIKNFNVLIIQSWIKCCVLNFNDVNINSNDANNETDFLKKYVSSLPEIRENILKNNDETQEFLNSNESIIIFFKIISKQRNFLRSDQQRAFFDELCRSFFHNIDKWVVQQFMEENGYSRLLPWVYKCIGTIIQFCSPILYQKNHPKNTLRMLINRAALGVEMTFTVTSTQRIFHMIMLGIENLNVSSDISLQTLVRELYEKYLPTFKSLINFENSNNSTEMDSLLKFFMEAKPQFSRLILETLTKNFITTPSNNSTHKICKLIMSLIRHLIKKGKLVSFEIVDTIVSSCSPPIFKCFMKAQQDYQHRQQTMDFLRDISLNPYYRENTQLREKLNQAAWSFLSPHIQTNSKVSFDFLNDVRRINIFLFEYLHPRFKTIVEDSEKNKLSNAAHLRFLLSTVRSTESSKSKQM